MKKLISVISLFVLTGTCSFAADTGVLITVPPGSHADAIITVDAPRSMDSYAIDLIKTGCFGEASFHVLRSNPLQNMDWGLPDDVYAPADGVSGYVYDDEANHAWVWYIWGLPPGTYYVSYSGNGILSLPDAYYGGPEGLAALLESMWARWTYDPADELTWTYLMAQGPYYYSVNDASGAMNVSATYSVY